MMGETEKQGVSADAPEIAEHPSASPTDQGEQRVEFHKPKAVHGWREFVNEIGVIVIGVLIALGAEQVAETLHWRHEVHAGEEALREDARELVSAAAQREAQSPCLARRFAAVASVISEGSASGRLPAVGQLGRPSLAPWKLTSWPSLVASQIATHMPRDRMLSYSYIAILGEQLGKQNEEEWQAWTDMYTIVGPGRAFPDAEQAAVRTALGRAVLLSKAQRESSVMLTKAISESGLLGSDEVRELRREAGDRYQIDARDGIMCKPLADAPPAASYGQAPSPVDLSAPFKP